MQLVILAGGKGTRLGLTDIPKPMASMKGKPLLEHQIELAKDYGIDEVFILSGHLAHVISDYFGDGSKWGIKICHIVEPYPLGTAGSLKLLEGQLKDRFLVFYGDVVMDFDIRAFQNFDAEKRGIATVLVHPNSHPYDSDLVEVNENFTVKSFLSKPHSEDLIYRNLVNAAVYIMSPKVMDYIESEVSSDFGKHVLPRLLKQNQKIYAYQTAEYIKDMGTKDRFSAVCQDLESGKVSRLNKRNARPAIFLDRDGTLNKDMGTNPNVRDFQLLIDVPQAISKINKSDYLSVVVTNQPMIAKGFVSFEDVENVHRKMETLLGKSHAYVDGIYYCPHHPERGFDGEILELKIDCECRKPKIGMLLQAQRDFNIDLSRSWMIGDSETDMIAGRAAGCKTVLVNNDSLETDFADHVSLNLLEAINFIMEESK